MDSTPTYPEIPGEVNQHNGSYCPEGSPGVEGPAGIDPPVLKNPLRRPLNRKARRANAALKRHSNRPRYRKA